MRISPFLLAIALVAASGCAGPDASPDGMDPSDRNGDATPVPGNSSLNVAPQANLTVDAANGTAPLNVTFGIHATDADGDNLTWALDADGDGNQDANGTVVPANFTFTFAVPGNYTSTVVVSDGNATVNATAVVQVVAGASPLEEIGRFEGTARVALFTHRAASYAVECPGFVTGTEGAGCFFTELPAGMAGQFAVYSTTAASTRLAFWDSCDAVDGSDVGWFEEGNPLELVVPDGAGCVIAWSASTADIGQERDFSLVVFG